MGMVSVASRIGAASSPFVVEMTRINAILPFALMGGLSFIAAVVMLYAMHGVCKRIHKTPCGGIQYNQALQLLKMIC